MNVILVMSFPTSHLNEFLLHSFAIHSPQYVKLWVYEFLIGCCISVKVFEHGVSIIRIFKTVKYLCQVSFIKVTDDSDLYNFVTTYIGELLVRTFLRKNDGFEKFYNSRPRTFPLVNTVWDIYIYYTCRIVKGS